MSTTRNILASSLFSMPFIGYQPVNISNGQPAVDAANLTKQVMLGAPFKWPWNRSSINFTTDTDSQDYLITDITDFGFLEQAWLTDPKGKVNEIGVRTSLAAESAVKRPASIAAQMLEDTDLTLRLNSIPDVIYTIEAYYQKTPVQMSSPANTWAPIPDYLSYIYDWGFMAMVSLLTKDARFPIYMGRFMSHLVGAQDGLTSLQRNIFLGNWLDVMSQQERSQLTTQQGVQVRAQ
jgi:hypothetical protein